jgi:anti-sigma factor RsiW
MKDDSKNVVDMDGMRVDDDHLLSMYIDGELDAERTISLAGRLKQEPALRARLSAMENSDRLVKKLYASQSADAGQALAALIRSENVAIFKPTARWREWATGAIAASVMAVVALSLTSEQSTFNPMTMDVHLAQALEHSPLAPLAGSNWMVRAISGRYSPSPQLMGAGAESLCWRITSHIGAV